MKDKPCCWHRNSNHPLITYRTPEKKKEKKKKTLVNGNSAGSEKRKT